MNTKLMIFKFVVVSMLLISVTTSCKKDVKGCTDTTADNYKDDANKDDGSCDFHGNFSSWYDNETRDSLLANDIGSVEVFVDGEIFINYDPSVLLWSAEPGCSTTTIGNWITMHNTKTKSISVRVSAVNSSNVEVRQWTETLNIGSGLCELYKISW